MSKVQEPELHRDLVSLNMIRNLQIQGSAVHFTILLTTPACPLRSQIEREARQAVATLPGVESVEIKMDANVPSDGRPRGLLELSIRNAIDIAWPLRLEPLDHVLVDTQGNQFLRRHWFESAANDTADYSVLGRTRGVLLWLRPSWET